MTSEEYKESCTMIKNSILSGTKPVSEAVNNLIDVYTEYTEDKKKDHDWSHLDPTWNIIKFYMNNPKKADFNK